MNRNEAGVLVKMIANFYPHEYAKVSQEQMKFIVDMWALTCEQYSLNQVMAAFRQYVAIDVTGFAPKPGQVMQYITLADDVKQLSESEAWAMVLRAASNAIYAAEEEFAALPETVQRAVGSAIILREIAMEDASNNSVTESHFKRAFRQISEQDRMKRRISPDAWKALEGDDDAPALPVGG